ncbi:MAG: hypothetical protein COB97_00560 [Paracoccus sp.]|nr:MAG: hypothetical protein COB97_00560 [Paracoccus sp. (in: a-proteobacteria)]
MRVEVEAALVRHLSQNDPSPAWIMAAERRFGWREDGVGFMRRFPWALGAQQKILQAAFEDELAKPPPARKRGLSPTEKGLLGGLGLILLVALKGYLGVTYPDTISKMNGIFVMAVVIALIAALTLFVAEAALTRFITDPTSQESGAPYWSGRFRRWWTRPAWRFSKRQILYAAPIILSVMVFTPLVSNWVSLSKPWSGPVSMEAESLYRRMFLFPRELHDRSPHFWMAEVPNFVVPSGGTTDQSDPYDIDAWRAFRSKTAWSGEHNPDAILSCNAPSSCQLGIRYDLGAVRVMVNEPEQRYITSMTDPVINLKTNDTDTVDVSWPNARFAQRNIGRYTKNQNDPSDDRLFLSKIDMYEPFVTYRGGSVALQRSFENLPIGLLAHPISLRFDWPASLDEASSCSRGSEKMTLADCGLDAGDIYDRQTFLCPLGDDGDACRNNLASQSSILDSTLDMMEQVNGSFVSAPTNDMNLLLQTLLYRMTIGGSHPPLPDSPEKRTLYRQVQRDYAIILDQPEAAADRENREALRAALSRQPHLYRPMRAEPEMRKALWDRFQAQLEAIGFSR